MSACIILTMLHLNLALIVINNQPNEFVRNTPRTFASVSSDSRRRNLCSHTRVCV